ncbi:nuclear pore complex protein Nup214 [Chelonus insularis]|uniref:nuclear pore complex protein Nup214 n=1 Tax=Chelonus insularis TaxID=460826 RepID=UPI001588CB1F|nr:nuclear pore complex protein Nup214 [Chelonus insularis]
MKPAPNPKDVQEFQFKQDQLIQAYENFKNIPISCNLILADSKRGLIYTAYENKLTVFKSNLSNDWRLDHNLPSVISRLSISCDCSYVGITFNSPTAHIYKASSISKNQLELINTVVISNVSQNVFAYDLRWNPAIPEMFCTVVSDHSIGTFQIKPDQKTTINVIALENIQGLEAECVAWSPKGKQLVIGCKNGNIIQLKPELKIARTITGPSPPIGGVTSILWISNYQFCAAYLDVNERRINVLIIDAPKGDTKTIFTCYEDITYGMPDVDAEYLPRYYFDHVPEWNLIIAASSSSGEIAVLGSLDNGAHWEQWQLNDNGRAQLPLVQTSESYPVGMAIDKSSTIILPWGPESTLPHPVPILYIYGTSGQIISFHMVNLFPNCPSLCSPPSEQFVLPQRTSMLPSEISFILNTGVTSTPRPKQIESSIERPKAVIPTPNSFTEPQKPTTTPQSVLTLQVSVQPQVELKIPRSRSEQSVEIHSSKPGIGISPVKELQTDPAAAIVDKINYDSIFWRNFCEEITHFEKELQSKLEPQTWDIGAEEEKQKLITQCAQMNEFGHDLMETTNSLASDVSYLKALYLQTFAWVEEIKSRNSANVCDVPKNCHDRSKIEELQKKFSHVQSQLLQAIKALDIHWVEQESQDRARMKIPSLEFIYQNLKKHAEIIAKEKEALDNLSKKWKTLSRGNKISSLNRSIAKLNISSNIPGSSGINGDGGVIEMRCRAIANNTKNFTREKQMRLRDLLLKTEPKIIKAINPSPVQDKLKATLTSLTSQNKTTITPKVKEKIVTNKLSGELPKVNVPSTKSATFVSNIIPVSVGTTTIVTTGITTTTITTSPATSIIKTTTTSQNPLASLNSIVAKLGNEPLTVTQQKTQPLTFSTSAFSLNFGNQTSVKLNEKSVITTSPHTIKSLLIQPTAASTQIPSITPINLKPFFSGSLEQKQESIVPVICKENTPKVPFTFKSTEQCTSAQSVSLFQTNSLENGLLNGATTVKVEQARGTQTNAPQNSGTSFNLSLNDSHSTVASTQQNVSNLNKNLSFNQNIGKSPTTTATAAVPVVNNQTFFLSVKPGDTTISNLAKTESLPLQTITTINTTVTTPVVAATGSTTKLPASDFSKMMMGLSTQSLTNKSQLGSAAPILITPTLTSSTATTINFGKVMSVTPIASPPGEANTFINLPSGTTIEKLLSPANTTTPVSSPSKMFGMGTGSNIFGGNTTNLSTSASIFTNTNPLTSTNVSDKSVVTTSAPALFGNASNGFSQPSNTSIMQSNVICQSINFGKPPSTCATPSNIFGKPAVSGTSTTSSMPALMSSSPFGQSTKSPMNAASPVKPFLANPETTPNASPFSAIQTCPTQNIFGGSTTSPKVTSIFGGIPTSPPSFGSSSMGSMFGGSPKPTGIIFGGAPSFGTPPMANTAAFGTPSTFGSKPVFGSQPVFGGSKPEFGTTFGSSFGTMGFGTSSPPLSNTPTDKVFGNVTGSNTFESLARQDTGLTFGSLAQKSPTAEKPSFSGGHSFTAWRS